MQNVEKQPSPDHLTNLQVSRNNSKLIESQLMLKLQTPNSQQYSEQSYRWVIVTLVSIAFAINNLANNAIIPISSKVTKVYGLSQTYANLPIQISFLINPIMNFTAGHFIDSRGLGISFRIGSVLYVVGMFGYCLINFGYHFVLIGSILVSLGQPFIINSTAKIATFWFMKENRSLATGIISAINILTLGIALVFPAIFVKEQSTGDIAKDQIFNLYSKYFISTVVNCIFIMIFMRQKPQKLPSAGAQQQKTHILKTFQIIKADTNLWKFFIASMLLYGTFLSFGSTSNMLFKPYGFIDTQIAIFGICLLVSGILGSVAYTLYIKKTLQYRKAIICACSLAVIFISAAVLLMNIASDQKIIIYLSIIGMGFNLIPMVPISYDLGCQLTFPVGQAQVVGILAGISMIYTVALTLTITSAIGFGTPSQSAINMGIYIALFFIGAVLYSNVTINLKRRDLQKQKQGKKTALSVGGQCQINQTVDNIQKDRNFQLKLNESCIQSQTEQAFSLKKNQIQLNSIYSPPKQEKKAQNLQTIENTQVSLFKKKMSFLQQQTIKQ